MVLGLHGELHVTVPVGAWTCLDLRKVCCQRWGVTLPSTDMTQCCWLGNHGRLEDTKPLEEVVRWQRGDNKIYVSRVISAAPAEQHQAAPAEQQRQVALEQAAPANQGAPGMCLCCNFAMCTDSSLSCPIHQCTNSGHSSSN